MHESALSASLAVSIQEAAPVDSKPAGGGSTRISRRHTQPAQQPDISEKPDTRKRRRSGFSSMVGGGDPVNYSALFHFLKLAERAANPSNSNAAGRNAAESLRKKLDTKLELELGAKSGVPIMSALDSAEMTSCVATLHSLMDCTPTATAASSSSETQADSGHIAVSPMPHSPQASAAAEAEAPTFRSIAATIPPSAVSSHVPQEALRADTAFDRHFLCMQSFAATQPLGLSTCLLQVNPLNAPCGVRGPLLHSTKALAQAGSGAPAADLIQLFRDPMYQGAILLIHPLLPVSWLNTIKAALAAAMPNEPLQEPLQFGSIMCDGLMCFGLDASSWDGLKVKMARAIEADNWAASRNGQQSHLQYGLVMQNWEAAVDLACMGIQGVQCLASSHTDAQGRVRGGSAWNQAAHSLNLKAATSTRVVRARQQLAFVSSAGKAEDVQEAVQWASWQLTQRLAALYAVCTTLHPAVAVAYSDGGVSATAPLDAIHARRRDVFNSLQRDVLPLFSAACGGDESGSPPAGWAARQALLRSTLEEAGGVWLGDGITPSILTMADGSELIYPGDLWLLLGVAQYGAGAWHRALYDPVLGLGWRPSSPTPAPPIAAGTGASAENLISLGEAPLPGAAHALVPLQAQVLLDCAFRALPARVFACLWSNLASSCEACLNVVFSLTLSGSLPSAAARPAAPQPSVSIPVLGLHGSHTTAATQPSASAIQRSATTPRSHAQHSSAGPAPLARPPPRQEHAATHGVPSSQPQAQPQHRGQSALQAQHPVSRLQLRDDWVVPHPQATGWVTLREAQHMLRERGDMLHQQLSTTVVALQQMGVNTSDFALRPVPALFSPENFPSYTTELHYKLATLPPAAASTLRDAHERMVKYRERLATVHTCSHDPVEYVKLLQQLWQNRVEQGKEPPNSQPPGTISAVDQVFRGQEGQ